MAKRFGEAHSRIATGGAPLGAKNRIKAVRAEWGSTVSELNAHQSQGITVEPIRRAKIAASLGRDHHRSERTSGKARGIVKGKV